MAESSIRSRRSELAKAGFLESVKGAREITPRGKEAHIWKITVKGRLFLSRLEDPAGPATHVQLTAVKGWASFSPGYTPTPEDIEAVNGIAKAAATKYGDKSVRVGKIHDPAVTAKIEIETEGL